MNYALIDIKRQINSMIFLNVMSYSVLSGCGNCSIPSPHELEELERALQTQPLDKRPLNIFFTDSLYKKCIPQYEADINNPYDFDCFKWTARKRKKVIDIDVMANSIICCCSLIERLLTFDLQVENRSLIIFILHKTAINQARFIKEYMKTGELYYNCEDVAEEGSDERHIQITPDNPGIDSQFAVFHSIAALIQLSNYGLYFWGYSLEELIEDMNILPGVLTSFTESMEELSSKKLTHIGLHLIEIYKKSGYATETCNKALNKLARELCNRTSETGEVLRGKDNEEISSLSTGAGCLNFLAQFSYMFSGKSSSEASSSIYQNLSSRWDKQSKLFILNSSSKQSYSIKDFAAFSSALFSYLTILQDAGIREDLQKQLVGFTETALLESGLFNAQAYPILQHSKLMLDNSIKYDKARPPVFNKAFEYKLSKKKYYCDADVFKADYVLPACTVLLSSINN